MKPANSLLLWMTIIFFKASLCEVEDYLNGEFSPESFLAVHDWFELKSYFYARKNESPQNLELVSQAENALIRLKDFRLDVIKNKLQKVQKEESNWYSSLEDGRLNFSDEQLNNFGIIIQLFPGSKEYLINKEFIFIFNYFGSETATSDLDYGLYRIHIASPQLEFFVEIQNIIDANTVIVQAAEEFKKMLGRTETSLQILLDLNGYPDMFVLYHRFFRFYNLSNIKEPLDIVFSNYFSSITLRICNNVQIHIYNHWLFNNDFLKESQDANIELCFRKYYEIIQQIEELKGVPKDLRTGNRTLKTIEEALDNFLKF